MFLITQPVTRIQILVEKMQFVLQSVSECSNLPEQKQLGEEPAGRGPGRGGAGPGGARAAQDGLRPRR